MQSRRRLFAIIAAFAVAFGALWPLVSQAHFGPKPIPSFICAHSGFHGGTPLPHEDKNHCPLCVIGAEATPPAAIAPVAWQPVATLTVDAVAEIAATVPFEARPPPSRAPPQHS